MFGEKDDSKKVERIASRLGLSQDEAKRTLEIAEGLKPKLMAALLELSHEEAKEILERVQGTEYEPILSEVALSSNVSFKQKFRIVKIFWLDYNGARRTLESAIRHVSVQELSIWHDWHPLERQEFRQTKEQGLFILTSLKDLLEYDVVDEWFVALAMDTWKSKEPDDIEAICESLGNIITQSDNPKILEKVAVFWGRFLPEVAERKLSQLFLDSANPKAKENAKRALILISKNPLSIIEGDQFVDNISLTGDFRGSSISIKSILKDVTIAVSNSANIDQPTKNELEELVKRLDEILEQVPSENAEDAEAVAETAKMLVETATHEKNNKTTIKITAQGLLQAAENIAKVMPVVLPIAKQIVALLVS